MVIETGRLKERDKVSEKRARDRMSVNVHKEFSALSNVQYSKVQ